MVTKRRSAANGVIMITKEKHEEALKGIESAIERLAEGSESDRELCANLKIFVLLVHGLEEKVKLWAEVGRNANFRAECNRVDLEKAQHELTRLRRKLFDLHGDKGGGNELF